MAIHSGSQNATLPAIAAWLFATLLTMQPALAQQEEPGHERTGTHQQPLVTAGATLWTEHDRHVPMCWHELNGFPSDAQRDAAKAFVMRTVQESWINLLNLRATWDDCPTEGDTQHVRVLLREGDSSYNGATKQLGVATLSNAADRRTAPPDDAPGLLMGFPAIWNQDDATREAFAGLIRHEFGHILGFTHENSREGPASAGCYENVVPDGYKIGQPDPGSIMGMGLLQHGGPGGHA